MGTIKINQSTVLLKDIQECINEFRKIQYNENEDKIICIKATTEILNIDPLLISYFLLFKTIMPEISISLQLETVEESTAYKIRQLHLYTYLVTGRNIFHFSINNEHEINYENANYIPTKYYVYSEKFSPFFFINENTEMFDFFFKNPSPENEPFSQPNITEETDAWQEIGKKWKEIVREKLYSSKITIPKSPEERRELITRLGRRAFFKALEEAKIEIAYYAEYYTKNNFPKDDDDWKIKYYKMIKPVFAELNGSSLIHRFVFSMILSTKMMQDPSYEKDMLTSKNAENTAAKITNLWHFTQDLVQGVKELAQNIREHSTPGQGVISLRLFDMEEWTRNKDDDPDSIYQYYKDELKKRFYENFLNSNKEPINEKEWEEKEFKKYGMIDVHVIDLGTEGIIPTLIKETTMSTDNRKREFTFDDAVKEDIRKLKDGNIKFNNLVDCSQISLNLQSKRSIAHLGLLILSKLVEKNGGMMIAATKGYNTDREEVTLPCSIGKKECIIRHGTFYNIHFPIRPIVNYTPHLPHPMKIPSDVSLTEIKGLEQLLDYEFITYGNKCEEVIDNRDKDVVLLMEIIPNKNAIINREQEDELWQSLLRQIEIFKDKQKVISCINLKETDINESQLFRLLGKYELFFPGIPVILYNVRNKLLQALIRINKEFWNINRHLSYWTDYPSILIYSFIETEENCPFHFSDLMCGKDEEEFLAINKRMINYPFSSVSLLDSSQHHESVDITSNNNNLFLYNNLNLLPFDLLLKFSETYSLFEQNSLVLLNNEIK